MKIIATALMAGLLLLSLTACETMHGFGKDVENAGEWVQEKSQ